MPVHWFPKPKHRHLFPYFLILQDNCHEKSHLLGLLAISLALNFLIFKDLADISQWLIQSSRDFTMLVWYNRQLLAAISLGTLVRRLAALAAPAQPLWRQDADRP